MKIGRLAGTIDLQPAEDLLLDPAKVCLAVFNEDSRKLAATTTPDEEGAFGIDGLENGRYRIIIRVAPERTCAKSILVEIDSSLDNTRGLSVSSKDHFRSNCFELVTDRALEALRFGERDWDHPFGILPDGSAYRPKSCSRVDKRIMYQVYLDHYNSRRAENLERAVQTAKLYISLCSTDKESSEIIEYFKEAIPKIERSIQDLDCPIDEYVR
ncbi:MAG: hypothetical protein IPM63_17790 [Acidobacteriota bacterium]|nr:MAG: hypothetical protein IPM63_17790 [Acidobacteriota bacterium]